MNDRSILILCIEWRRSVWFCRGLGWFAAVNGYRRRLVVCLAETGDAVCGAFGRSFGRGARALKARRPGCSLAKCRRGARPFGQQHNALCRVFLVRGGSCGDYFFNRGANGIDGTLSTALGVAHEGAPAFLLSGDLLSTRCNGLLAANPLSEPDCRCDQYTVAGFLILPVAEQTVDFESLLQRQRFPLQLYQRLTMFRTI